MMMVCPFHDDDTPSLKVYDDGKYFCFGCRKAGPADELGVSVKPSKRYIEPLDKTISYIKTLPTKLIRGLELPYDDTRYYLVWPDNSYYISRLHTNVPGKSKYSCPTGHPKPLYIPTTPSGAQHLLICEGQLNALSISKCSTTTQVVSPGGTGDFKDKNYLDYYSKYDSITICVDDDGPGALAAIELSTLLIPYGKKVKTALWRPDANDVLVTYGKEELEKRINLAMQGGLSDYQRAMSSS